uniref:Uncharacterized protein n=1 Tax=Avena sativa TaxID=4498 RepID=A0ACD5XXN8_AVESA
MEKDVTHPVMRVAAEGNLRALKEMAAVAANKGGVWNRALALAAMDGRMDVCRLLVEDVRVDVNQPANDVAPLCHSGWRMEGATAVFISAMYGTADTTRYLLDHGADPAVAGSLGSALHGAAMTGQCENVELLLSRGFDVDLFDSVHGTALHIAASKGEAGVVKILLEHHADAGADVNFVDYIGVTYLMVAVNNGLLDLMRCLLDAGANPNTPDAVSSYVLLFFVLLVFTCR